MKSPTGVPWHILQIIKIVVILTLNYNWNPGNITFIPGTNKFVPDTDLKLMEFYKGAKPFLSKASYKETVTMTISIGILINSIEVNYVGVKQYI